MAMVESNDVEKYDDPFHTELVMVVLCQRGHELMHTYINPKCRELLGDPRRRKMIIDALRETADSFEFEGRKPQ